jgi:antitoxin component YwqK of YwqJK toxin-antitoxin module
MKNIYLAITVIAVCCCQKKQKEVAYYDNGQLKKEIILQDGLRQGIGIDYYRSGKIYAKSFWQNGKIHGKHTIHFENGIIKQVDIPSPSESPPRDSEHS